MDKNAIKKYAVWARRELIEKVSQRAMMYGIAAKGPVDPNAESVNGHLLTRTEKAQRQALIRKIREQGFEQVMEEVAYTWFNRFAALRFMEVNGYLPSHVRVFTNDAGEFKPQILSEAIHLELEGLDRNKVYELESANKTEELFKYLLIVQCNALNSILSGMFQKIDDYTELLLPDYLLREGSVIEQMVAAIPEEDWNDQVQIIGWLYQYYNSEPKDKVFADLKKNIKITKENIPAATQLFTPDWIVHYMVENSLARLWLEGHPNDAMKTEFKYYLDEAEQEPEVEAQLAEIRKEYAALKPEEIRVIDPCCGSGHILCVLFDVLIRIYEDYGYTAREAAAMIVENNLWGLDIDERAAQLSYFAVMMKARQYDRRFFSRNVQPHVYAIEESNGFTTAPLHDMGLDLTQDEYGEAVKQILRLIEETHDAKEYGSIISVTPCDWDLLRRFAVPRWVSEGGQIPMEIHGEIEAAPRLQRLCDIGEALSQKYHVVVTNPPYMASSGMGNIIGEFVKTKYSDSKNDLYSVFIERCRDFTALNGFQAMITQHTWMFLGSYERLRQKLQHGNLESLIHLGIKAFEEIGNDVVQTASFVTRNSFIPDFKTMFVRLVDYKEYRLKEEEFFSHSNRYIQKTNNFDSIPGLTYAYWVNKSFIDNFKKGYTIESYGEFTGSQNITGNNEKYLRCFWEVESQKIGREHWVLYAKGGDYRKYYGNLQVVVDWRPSARSFYESNKTSNLLNEHFWFKEGITYSAVTSRGTGFRYMPPNCVFDKGGPSIAVHSRLIEVLALLNSKVAETYFQVLNPSINLQVKDIKALPIILPDDESVLSRAKETLKLAEEDWNSSETSMGFKCHPLATGKGYIKRAFESWDAHQKECFERARKNELEVNEIFCKLYGFDNIQISFEDRDIPVRLAGRTAAIKSLISYAVGCIFGRYSIDVPGIVYAGGKWDNSKYHSFVPDKDGICPVCDDDYFEDDIVDYFVKFIRAEFGEEYLEENLHYIAETLGGKGTPRKVIRDYFLNEFFLDHCNTYAITGSGKRPIYWLFDSGKKNGFKCLIYMHRYQPDTIARIRTDYVHEQQSRYRTVIADLEQRINSASTSERVKLSKQLAKVQDQAEELRVYEEKIHHLADQMIPIDLDDGVKVNYAKFQDVLAKIK